jgi:hypothetical protein
MKLARFWTRDEGEAVGPSGDRVRIVARGWSDQSVEAARAKAREIAQRVAQRIVSPGGKQDRYPYGDRPLPEPVIEKLGSSVVTRNAYGALVLNADRMMFIDVDREEATPFDGSASGIVSGIFSLFGKAAPTPSKTDPAVEDIQRIAARRQLAGRVYKTAGGYRVLITNTEFHAGSAETEALLKEFGSDPLYVRLCRLQESFRARLTPKPWRCGFYQPRVSFPFETPDAEAEFRTWESKYASKAAAYSTCRYLTAFGDARTAPEFHDLIEYHDRETKASSGLPLA